MSNESAAVTHVMEPVLPGTCVVMTIGGWKPDMAVYARRVADGPARTPGAPARKAGTKPAAWRRWRILQTTAECLTVDVPAGSFGVYALAIDRKAPDRDLWVANRPRLDWVWPQTPAVGAILRLLGRCFVDVGLYRQTDPRKPTSFGGFFAGRTVLLARAAGGGRFVKIPVQQSSAYEIHARIPDGMAPGEYDLFAHNGRGGVSGWSDPMRITIAARQEWPRKVFHLDRYCGQRKGDVDKAFQKALADLEANKGGILELGPRTYDISRPIILPRMTLLRGAGKSRTLIRLPRPILLAEGEPPKPPYVAVMGDGDFAVEDLCIQGVNAPILIAAPVVPAASFDEAFVAGGSFGDRRCNNVAVRRCHLEQNPLWHVDRRSDKDHIRRMEEYGHARAKAGEQFSCLMLRGDNIEIEGNTVLGGGSALFINRSSHVRVANNTLSAGAAGLALAFLSGLKWPADFPRGGGAKIRGNCCHSLLIEDNELAARSDHARNLLSIMFGGERIHVARNTIHRIAPNNDAESLLTHLWQARWPLASISMHDALTGEIHDPKGQVTRECLDGAVIDVVDGRGVGQIRDIVSRQGTTFTIDRPWKSTPDATSRVVFTAPPSCRIMTIVDNRVVSQAENIIIWGTTHDTVIDGNYCADGRAISLWSIRLEAKQGVWGGAVFTQIIHNVVDRGWLAPVAHKDLLAAPTGISFVGCRQATGCDLGYDCLGLIVRANHATNNTGIGFRTTYEWGADWDGTAAPRKTWRIREAGVVIENNLSTDSSMGVIMEKGTHAIVRANRARNVTYPLAWLAAPGSSNK